MEKGVVLVGLLVGIVAYILNSKGYFTTRLTDIVKTKDGPVQGVVKVSRDGRDYSAYFGIPFAEPPIGQLRFEPPVPAKSWTGVFQADTHSQDCFQFEALVRGKYLGQEDCLYLNVYKPNINDASRKTKDASLPVMVWIYGGGFLAGGSYHYRPKYFMDQDVIMVTFNYRLGPLGFLNTGNTSVSGNAGLKDQRLALRWIKDNIAAFGGDPDKITIFGESAGAASVHAHILSPGSNNLFRKGIMQSGSLAAPWSMNVNPARQAKTYGARVNCDHEDMQEMVECLKGLTAKQITEPIEDFMDNSPFVEGDDFFGPTVESTSTIDPFFNENPRLFLEQGKFSKVPVMMGVTEGEGGIRTARLDAINMDVATFQEKFAEIVPMLTFYNPKRTDVTEKMRQFYFPDNTVLSRDEYFQNITKMVSAGWFFHALHRAAVHHNRVAPVYLYYYDYEATLPSIYSAMRSVANSKEWLWAEISAGISIVQDLFKRYFGLPGPHDYGACHADDLLQLFYMEWPLEIGQNSADYKFSKDLVKAFADFAINDQGLKFKGKSWPVLETGSVADNKYPFPFMALNRDGGLIDEPFFDIIQFWDSLNIRDFRAKVDW